MIQYLEVNRNPKGRKTGDCVTRALAGILGITWAEALKEQYEMALKKSLSWGDKKLEDAVLKKYGYIKCPQPKKPNGTKYRLYELDKVVTPYQMSLGIYVTVAHHATYVVDGAVEDIWDCRGYTIRNYWVKEV